MRLSLTLVAVTAVSLLPTLRAEEPPGFDRKRVAALIDQLGDPRFGMRELAEKELVQTGEPALYQVRNVLKTTEVPEVERRLERIERAMLWSMCESKGCGLRLMVTDPGEFEMGSSDREPGHREDETPHTVRIHRAFLIGKHEVTQAEFKKVTGANPSYFTPTGEGKAKVKDLNTHRLPVEQVSWYDAITFCNQLSQADGYPAYYELTEQKAAGDSIASAKVKVLGGTGYRLPTEAEWEYAARAGTRSAYSFGEDPAQLLPDVSGCRKEPSGAEGVVLAIILRPAEVGQALVRFCLLPGEG